MKKGVKLPKDLTRFVAGEKRELFPAILLGAVDSYVESVCESGFRAKDCGSVSRIEKLEKALHFAREIYEYLGVKDL